MTHPPSTKRSPPSGQRLAIIGAAIVAGAGAWLAVCACKQDPGPTDTANTVPTTAVSSADPKKEPPPPSEPTTVAAATPAPAGTPTTIPTARPAGSALPPSAATPIVRSLDAGAAPSVASSQTAIADAAAASATTAAVAAKPVSARVSGTHFTVDFTAPGSCAVGAECAGTLRITALGGYHINKEYPYKFKATEGPSVEYLGRGPAGKAVFSKSAGDFHQDAETVATMNVRWKPLQKGTVAVTGTYSMSVCSEANCETPTPEVALNVPAN